MAAVRVGSVAIIPTYMEVEVGQMQMQASQQRKQTEDKPQKKQRR